MKSYDILEWGKPLQEVIRETPSPIGEQVLVKVSACGVCHSDLHIRAGSLDLGNGRQVTFESIGLTLPFTLGHEIVGTIAQVGPDSSAIPGTPCVVYPWQGCGLCRHCQRGDELSCERGEALGTRRAGGYADFVMVKHQRYLLDYGALDPLLAATCACSGLTAYSALRKLPRLTADDVLLLIGAGGLGLAALGLSPELCGARVIVGDIDPVKVALARDAGARETIDMVPGDAAAALRTSIGEGVRAVIDFVGSPTTLEFAMKVAGKGATIIVVGLFGGALSLPTVSLPSRNMTLRGSYVGSLNEMVELLALLQRKPVLKVPLVARPLSEINQTLRDLEDGKIRGRVVALPAT